MASMSYCRHENAASDFQGVLEQWNEGVEQMSHYEHEARRTLLAQAYLLVHAAQEVGVMDEDGELIDEASRVELPIDVY